MAGRPRSFDRDAAVDRFVEMFWTGGYSGTSIDELQAAVGIQRGSFYAAFGDKECAYRAALGRYVEDVTSRGLAVLDGAAGPRAGLVALIRFLGAFMAGNPGRGCFLFSALSQPPPVGDETAEALEAAGSVMRDRIVETARAAAESGELGPGETADGLAAMVTTIVFGLNGMARAGVAPDSIRAAADTAAALLDRSEQGD